MNKIKLLFLITVIYASILNAANNPTVDFKLIAEKCKIAFNARPAVEISMNQKNQNWVKKLFSPTVITFDAKRTDSIIFPLLGHIEIIETVAFKSDPNEDAIKSAELSINDTSIQAIKFVTRINYNFDGTAWSVSGGTKSTAFRQIGTSSFERNPQPLTYSVEKINNFEGPISNCIK